MKEFAEVHFPALFQKKENFHDEFVVEIKDRCILK